MSVSLNTILDFSSAPNASNVHRLLEFYRALAPVCIGGPSSTTLELELSGPPHALTPTKQQGRENVSTRCFFY